MRTYDAIEKVSSEIIKDNICEAILIKGSIGRGDDDEFSDVDLYVVVSSENMKSFLDKRLDYLNKYLPVIYFEYVNFVADQIVAIYDNGLHFDLYTVTKDTLPYTDKAKVIYDPAHQFDNYTAEVRILTPEELASSFHDCLYYFVEADGAYCRKNYPWTSTIMTYAIAESSKLLRYLYDREHAYLGLKKLNEIIPEEQFSWVTEASANLKKDCYQKANAYIIQILDYVFEHIDDNTKSHFNLTFFEWVKSSLGTILFVKK